MSRQLCLGLCAIVVGCAVTPGEFASRRYLMADVDVCDAERDAAKTSDYAFRQAVQAEIERRNLDTHACALLLKKRSDQRAAVAAAILAVAAVAAVAANSKGGGGGRSTPYYAPAQTSDTEWAWDQFYNDQWKLVWACRGVQTGQFAEQSRCAYKYQSDIRWPDKTAPWRK